MNFLVGGKIEVTEKQKAKQKNTGNIGKQQQRQPAQTNAQVQHSNQQERKDNEYQHVHKK